MSDSLFQEFDAFHDKFSKEYLQKKIETYLIKEEGIRDYFILTEEAFILYDSPRSKALKKEEYRLRLTSEPEGKESLSKPFRSLVGAKIALDPGHFGGPFAKLEQRFIEIEDKVQGSSFLFNEGDLTLFTALYLKELLEQRGAIVFLTRSQEGQGAVEYDFHQWLKQTYKETPPQQTHARIFRESYNPIDMRERAKKINAFNPDLTVIIHYNAHEVEEGTQVTDKNYNMVFLPGSFCGKELTDVQSRYEFMRLLVTEDLEQSEKFCRIAIEKMNQTLGVPSVTEEDGAHYLKRSSLKIADGVYARNLCLTRLIHSPLCYGESLVQNNKEECIRLAQKDGQIGAKKISNRIKLVSQAYLQAIEEYFQK